MTDPEINLGVMTQATSIRKAQVHQQTGLLAVQEESSPDRLLLAGPHAVQLELHHKVFTCKKYAHSQDTNASLYKESAVYVCRSVTRVAPHIGKKADYHEKVDSDSAVEKKWCSEPHCCTDSPGLIHPCT